MKTARYRILSRGVSCTCFTVLLMGVVVGVAASAQAATDTSPQFAVAAPQKRDTQASIFAKGTSMSPFVAKVEENERKDLEFFPRTNDLRLDFTQEQEKQEGEGAQASEQSEKDKNNEKNIGSLPPREKLLAKYGDPTKDAPVLAIDNAPMPFKAMMESIQEGDQEIAFQYAKQYVRHLKNLQERSTQVMSLVGLAQRREHMADDAGTWSKAPVLEEHKLVYQRDVEEELKKASAGQGGSEVAIEQAANMLLMKGRAGLTAQNSAQKPNSQQPTLGFVGGRR